jgi:hypothetical protein
LELPHNIVLHDHRRPARSPSPETDSSSVAVVDEPAGELRLCSAGLLCGCDILAQDGGFGHVRDLVIDDRTWQIHGLVVHTRKWWPGGKKVLIEVDHVGDVDWAHAKVQVNMIRDEIRTSPEYDADMSPYW